MCYSKKFATGTEETFWGAIAIDTEHMLALFLLRIVEGWKTLSPHEQGSRDEPFMANNMVRVESGICVGVCVGHTFFTNLK